jgi:hypothetical protein
MKIRYVSPSPKAGKEEHVENTAGRALVLAGFAEEVPYKNYRERLAEESKQIAAAATAPPIDQWAINQSTSNDPNAPRFVVAHTTVLGTTYYNAPPKHAPAHVKQRFRDLVATDDNAWKERQEFLKRQAAESSTTTGYHQGDLARVTVIGKGGTR